MGCRLGAMQLPLAGSSCAVALALLAHTSVATIAGVFVLSEDDRFHADVSSAGAQRGLHVALAHAGGARLSWAEAVSALTAEAPGFRALLSRVLRESPFPAFFWECPPVSAATAAQRSFEFVLLDAPGLEQFRAEGEHLWGRQGAWASGRPLLT